jgi:RNA polymerase sigma-70 factor (ECF subfamily)
MGIGMRRRRTAEGEWHEFDAWYRREHPRLLRILTVAAGDPRLAEEITSEAFARALERWDRVRSMQAPEGWTYRVAVNLLRRHQRQGKREAATEMPSSTPVDLGDTEFDLDLWQAVRSLPTQMRLAIAFRYVADMTEADVAAAMGIAPGSASATLVAARRRLAHILGPGSMEHEVGSHE